MNSIRLLGTEKNEYYVWTLGVYFLMLPAGAVSAGTVGSLLRVIGFALFLVGIWQYQKVKKKRQLLYIFLFVCWIVLSIFWSLDVTASLGRIFSNVCFLLLLFTTAAREYREKDLVFLKRCLVWSSRITLPLVAVFAGLYEGRLRTEGMFSEDPNYLCMYFSYGVVFCVEKLCEDRPIRSKLPFAAELFFYLGIIIVTGSRGGALAIALMMCCAFFQCRRRRTYCMRVPVRKLLLWLTVLAACVILLNIFFHDLVTRYSITEIISLRGAGRFEIWRDALRTFWNADLFHKLCGFGIGTARRVSQIYSIARNTVMHNMFLENLIEAGMVGLSLYTIYIFGFWNGARKSKDVFAAAVMSGMIVMSMSVSIYAFKPYWNIMIYILCLQNRKGLEKKPPSQESRCPEYGSGRLWETSADPGEVQEK